MVAKKEKSFACNVKQQLVMLVYALTVVILRVGCIEKLLLNLVLTKERIKLFQCDMALM